MYFLRGAAAYFACGIVFAVLVSLFEMISPKVISFTVDSVIGSETVSLPAFLHPLLNAAGGVAGLRAHPLRIALIVAGIGAAGALCRFIFRTFNARGAEAFTERMRNELFTHILHLPYAWHSENSTGDIIQRCTSDVQTIKRFVSEQMVQLIRTVILIALAISFMAGINVKLMLISAAFIPVIVGYSLYFHTKIGDSFEKVDVEEGVLSTIAQENLTGVRVVRAFGRELYERGRFEKQNEYYTGFWIHLMKLLSAFWASGDVLTGLQTLAVLLSGAASCIRGTLTVGDFIALLSYNTMLIWPVRALGRVISEMSKAGISIDRLRYIMNSPPEEDAENALTPPMDRDIVFENVSFSYAPSVNEEHTKYEDVLRNVSFRIPAGSTVGILGGTGSGKSTLMYLLEGMYALKEGLGRITIGGIDIADIKKDYLRENIGMVLQEPFLFSRTLSENIGIAAPGSDKKMIRQAAKSASIDDAIESFTKGYDTFVGERGVTLSGGQKQRTAIAQMLIRKPPVMVFDDSLSAVDAETDAKIRQAIRENTGSATVILIAHRITTLMNADHIVVLDKGRVLEEGTHEGLLAKGGLYKRIFELQTEGLDTQQ